MKHSEESVRDYLGIVIDYSRDKSLPEQGKALLTRDGFYKLSHERSPQETFARAATSYSFGDYDFAQRIYDYASKGWFTFASPVLSNSVEVNWPTCTEMEFEQAADWLEENVTPDGLPISCFLSLIPDSKEGLVSTRAETAWLSMMGGGIGIYPSNRSPDEKSTGVMAHLRGYDSDALAYKQTTSRRGSIADYMDVTHPEIMQFLQMRNPVGGDPNQKCFNLNNAVNIPDSFMEAVIRGESYELIDPKHGPTNSYLDAREVWDAILETRYETGEPYIMLIDNVNRQIPDWIHNPLYHVRQSNLCSEITLMTNERRTAVCCLSSLNLEKYDEWKDSNIVQDLVRMLDNVLEYFIRLAPKHLQRAVYSASKERSIGIGTLGWHSYLQSKDIAFESEGFNSAMHHTEFLFKKIKERAVEESMRLGEIRGEAPDTAGSGMRNAHLLSVAPNASSSSIVNTSPSIEPWNSNAFNAQGRAGSFLIKNKYLEGVFDKHGINNADTWKSVILNEGSVQHIEELTEHERNVFKTANEIAPEWIVEQAAARQKYICQSQSLNIFVDTDMTAQRMSDIHIMGWLKGVKTFYYCRSKPATRAKVGDGGKKPLNSVQPNLLPEETECRSCEG